MDFDSPVEEDFNSRRSRRRPEEENDEPRPMDFNRGARLGRPPNGQPDEPSEQPHEPSSVIRRIRLDSNPLRVSVFHKPLRRGS